MPHVEIAPGYSIPRVIKGMWQYSTGHTPGQEFSDDHAAADIEAYRKAGMNTLDCGDIYKGVESLIGRCREKLSGPVRVHTKYVPDQNILADHTVEDARAIVERSCTRLGTDALDMVQFHWWNYDVKRYVEAMRALAELRDQGKIRVLGVTNFDVPRMQEFVDAGVKPATIQLQYSLLDRRPAGEMTAFCAEHDIKMLCYGTAAGSLLSEKYLGMPEPQPGTHETRSITKYLLIIQEFGGWELFQELLRSLKLIADVHGTSISNIASAFVLHQPQVAAVIMGARNSSHIAEHAALPHITLSTQDMEAIEAILDRSNPLPGDVYSLERTPEHSRVMHMNNNGQMDMRTAR